MNVAITSLILKIKMSKGSYVITDLIQLYLYCIGNAYTYRGSVCFLGSTYDKFCWNKPVVFLFVECLFSICWHKTWKWVKQQGEREEGKLAGDKLKFSRFLQKSNELTKSSGFVYSCFGKQKCKGDLISMICFGLLLTSWLWYSSGRKYFWNNNAPPHALFRNTL